MKDGRAFLPNKLRRRAENRGDALALAFLDDGEAITASFTLEALDARVDDVAFLLLEETREDDRVLLLFPPGLDFVVAFLACLRAGRVAVPAIPPEPHKPARSLARLAHLVTDAAPSAVLVTAAVLPFRDILHDAVPALRALPFLDVAAAPRASVRPDDPRGDALAFLQYTSGSTGSPRGVCVSRENLTENLGVIHGVAPFPPKGSVSWLPQFHDMGLIEGILLPLDGGYPAWLMPPFAFLEKPLRWLRAVERFSATRSGGPNFAYDLCVRKIAPEERERLDLSCFRQAYCGAEPIRAASLRAFAEAFAPARFSPDSFFPCYGLAEHTVLASCRTHAPFTVESIAAAALASGEARRAEAGERAIDVVCVGEIPPAVALLVVDPETREVRPDGTIGEIWLGGGSVAGGYFRDAAATAETFGAMLEDGRGPFLRTGDLGYRRGEMLFIVGRRKDVLFVRGENHHAHDVERAAEGAHPAIRRGCVAAVSLDDASRPVVACEVKDGLDDAARADVVAAVHRAVLFEQGIAVDVVLVPKHTLPKTSSGKLQRRATADMLRAEMPRLPIESKRAPPRDESAIDAAIGALARIAGIRASEIDPDLPPSRLPLDSLQIADAAAALEALLGRPISLDAFGRAISLRALVLGADEGERSLLEDLARDLPPVAPRKHEGGAILVTGGTGFVGRAVVAELETRGHRVRVLARGARGSGSVAGDVSASRFGLSEAAFDALAAEIDVVVHIAGAVSWVLPHSALAPTNVGGTAEVIAFSARAGARLVHVSSQIVCHDGRAAPGAVIDDDEPASALEERLARLPLGYATSKAVAELLVEKARRAGLDATIVRPSLVLAGASPDPSADDVVSILLGACIAAGAAPDLDLPFSVCPRQTLSRVVADLVSSGPRLVHVGDESRSLREIAAWLSLAGHDVVLVPFETFLARVEALGLHRNPPLRGLWPFLRGGTIKRYERPHRARVAVRAHHLCDEPVDAAFLDECLASWRAISALPPPRRQGAHATAASRALPTPPREVRVEGARVEVARARVSPVLPGEGLLSRLAAGFCDRPVGVYPATLELVDGRTLDVVLKAPATGEELARLCAAFARVTNAPLSDALYSHASLLDVGAADLRERALYRSPAPPTLAGIRPRCFSCPDDAEGAPLVLERLRAGDQVEALDRIAKAWPLGDVERAVRGLAAFHAQSIHRGEELSGVPWARAEGTNASTLLPLWRALFAHARARMDAAIADAAAPLLDDLGWAEALSGLPRVLLHNDVNPRNLALRADGAPSEIVLYDWELAALGPGVRDLAELLCFTLDPGVDEGDAASLVARHASIATPGVGERALREAFGAALAWFFFDRLTTYTVISPVFELPWLGRVFAAWRRLFGIFEPAT